MANGIRISACVQNEMSVLLLNFYVCVRSPVTSQKLNIIEWQVGGTDWHIFSLFVQQKYLTDMANSNSLAIYNLQIQNTKSKYINNL